MEPTNCSESFPLCPADALDTSAWMDLFLRALQAAFGSRLVFVGLQGSRGRGEGRPDSDIDVVVILDSLSMDDLTSYEALLERLPHRELVCGFVSGRAELVAWAPSELFQFARDTHPWLGSLDELLPPIPPEEIRRAIHTGACSLYHAAVHNLLHDKSVSLLAELFKQAGFTLQAKHFFNTGENLSSPQALLPRLGEEDRAILAGRKQAAALTDQEEPAFRALSGTLITWSSRLIQTYSDPSRLDIK